MGGKVARLLALSAVLVLGAPSPAVAVSGAQDFELFVIGRGPTPPGRVVASGVITDAGTARQISLVPNPDGTVTGTNIYSFDDGDLIVQFTGAPTSLEFDPVRCITYFTAAGTFVILGGTGAYSGASGSGTFTSEGRTILTRTASGCGPPSYEITRVHDVGTIVLP